MPGRKIPLITKEIYHVFNRGLDKRTTFGSKREFSRAIESLNFYRYANPPIRLSQFLRLNPEEAAKILHKMEESDKLVEIIAFCLMPNHFHLLLRQLQDGGISKFLSNFTNSYTRYFNTKQKRAGSLFLDQFKAVRIEDDNQLIHVSRYIHLNPYTGFIVSSISELESYVWSSLAHYLGNKNTLIESKIVITFFKTPEEYRKFITDQANYQRTLKMIEHLTLE